MAPIVENRAIVSGTIKSITEHAKMKGYMQITLSLKESKDIDDFPNLARADEGTEIVINVPAGDFAKTDFEEGKAFKGTVRKAFGQVYFLEAGSQAEAPGQ